MIKYITQINWKWIGLEDWRVKSSYLIYKMKSLKSTQSDFALFVLIEIWAFYFNQRRNDSVSTFNILCRLFYVQTNEVKVEWSGTTLYIICIELSALNMLNIQKFCAEIIKNTKSPTHTSKMILFSL